MNNGKVCISICARTAGELCEKIEDAKPLADLVELRFDCLSKDQIEPARALIQKDKPLISYIMTFRSPEQGGLRNLSFDDRKNFWSQGIEGAIADVEEDMVGKTSRSLWSARICSLHDFSGVPSDLNNIFLRLAAANSEILKIAVNVNNAVDAIPVWNLLDLASSTGKEIIPIAMGEAGKWTRILGPAHGAYLTYAAPETGNETAPGQITAIDLIEVYRVREIDKKTEVYGIIAGDTSYTMSPYIHNAAFKAAGLNAVFVPFQVGDLDEFVTRMVRPETREVELNFRGFSVTNPHKQAIIKHLDVLNETARKSGAVNTVAIVDGKLHGYNTDADGFLDSIKGKFGRDFESVPVAVLGAGGAARACVYVLKSMDADVTVFARDQAKARVFAESFDVKVESLAESEKIDFSEFEIVVNTTPLGTRGPRVNASIATARQLKNVKLVCDLVYNPAETSLLHEARQAGAETLGGFDMLIAQAARQFEIWTGVNAPVNEISAAAKKRLHDS